MQRPRKRLGQHFLHDRGVIERILAAIDPRPGQAMVEIGPGLGALTRPLLQRLGELHCVELDRDLLAQLQACCRDLGTLHVHQGDALSFDFGALAPGGSALRVVGNLPYNISTPLLFHLLADAHAIADMHFLLQREVVDRLTASPGSSDYGRLSVMVQYRCRARRLFRVGAGAFRPPPQVESAFVQLVPWQPLPTPAADEQALAAVVRRAFGQRRKTLRRSLRGALDAADIQAAGLDPGQRPERVPVAGFVALADRLAGQAQR